MIYDAITEERLSCVFMPLAYQWRLVAQQMWADHQVQIKVSCGLRTFAQQWGVYQKGRLKDESGGWMICDIKKVVTYALPGQSFHQYGLAIDSAFMGSDPFLEKIDQKEAKFLWSEYGRICKLNSLMWGGDWKFPDRPHCQMTFGLNFHELQILYEDNGLKGVWSKCTNLAKCGSEV